MSVPFPQFVTDYVPPAYELDHLPGPKEKEPQPELVPMPTMADLREGVQVPQPQGKHYWFNHGEVRGIEIMNRSHQGFLRIGVNADYTDHATLQPIYEERQARLDKCREDFQAFKAGFLLGPEAQKLKAVREKLALIKQEEESAQKAHDSAGGAMGRAYLEDGPLEVHEQAQETAKRQLKKSAFLRGLFEQRLKQAQGEYDRAWETAKDLWIESQLKAAKDREEKLEAQMIEQLGKTAAKLEQERAIGSELASSFYSHTSAPELLTPEVNHDPSLQPV